MKGRKLGSRNAGAVSPWQLSQGEARAMDAVLSHGKTPAAASFLGVAPSTVNAMLARAYKKLGVYNRWSALQKWREWRANSASPV